MEGEPDFAVISADEPAHVTGPGLVGSRILNGALAEQSEDIVDFIFRDAQVRDTAVGVEAEGEDDLAGMVAGEIPLIEQIEPALLDGGDNGGIVRAEGSCFNVEAFGDGEPADAPVLLHFFAHEPGVGLLAEGFGNSAGSLPGLG